MYAKSQPLCRTRFYSRAPYNKEVCTVLIGNNTDEYVGYPFTAFNTTEGTLFDEPCIKYSHWSSWTEVEKHYHDVVIRSLRNVEPKPSLPSMDNSCKFRGYASADRHQTPSDSEYDSDVHFEPEFFLTEPNLDFW